MKTSTLLILAGVTVSLFCTSIFLSDFDLLKTYKKEIADKEETAKRKEDGRLWTAVEKTVSADRTAGNKAQSAAVRRQLLSLRSQPADYADDTEIALEMPAEQEYIQVEDYDTADKVPMEPSSDNINVMPAGEYAEEIMAGYHAADQPTEEYDEAGNLLMEPSSDNINVMPTVEYAEEIMVAQNTVDQPTDDYFAADEMAE